MPNIGRMKNLIALSDWLTYELETELLTPPIIKLKIKPVDSLIVYDVQKDSRFSKCVTEMLLDAVQEWDLVDGDKPLPCDEKNKRKYLPLLFGMKIKEKTTLLGIEILSFAGEIENFLKN